MKFYENKHPAILYEKSGLQDYVVRCLLCSHYCEIEEGKTGTCMVRFNEGGELFTRSWGNAQGLAIDPIEKKPFYHFKPSTRVLSFGTPGCNFRCLNCQNCDLSQAFRRKEAIFYRAQTPEHIAKSAERYKVDGLSYTYSEPTIFFEYARDTIKTAGDDYFHVFVSNGYFSKETLELIEKENLIQAVNIDLKFINDEKYHRISGGHLQPVLDSIERVWNLRDKILLEIINLVIPGENDSDEDFQKISDFIFSLSPDIPLHFSRFYPNFKMADKPATEISRLVKAKEIAEKTGINHVYIGNTNIPGAEDTHCPECNTLLISRSRFGVIENVFSESNSPHCPVCGKTINIVL